MMHFYAIFRKLLDCNKIHVILFFIFSVAFIIDCQFSPYRIIQTIGSLYDLFFLFLVNSNAIVSTSNDLVKKELEHWSCINT